MVVVIPEGRPDDPTRKCDFYDPTFDYLKSICFPDIQRIAADDFPSAMELSRGVPRMLLGPWTLAAPGSRRIK
jgi:hypothetical protein